MSVRLSSYWFNPLYWHLRHYVKIPTIRKIMVYGGKSSSKTVTISQLLTILCHNESQSAIAYRKEQSTIKTTLKNAFKKAISSIKFDSAYNVMDFSLRGVKGQEIVFKGLDVEGKIKGIEGYKYLLMDELDHFTQEEWNMANLSLRGIPNQKLFATWNPVRDDIWIKEELDNYTWTNLPLELEGNPLSRMHENSFIRLSDDGKILLIRTTYFDNKWMVGGYDEEMDIHFGMRDENLIHEYELLGRVNENWYLVNVLGEWGKPEVKKPFAYNFSKEKHVSKTPLFFIPSIAKRFVQDFNVDPMANICGYQWFDNEGHHIRFVREKALFNSGTEEMIEHLKSNYTAQDHANALWTGDATSRKRTAEQSIKGTQHLTSWVKIDKAFNLGKRLQTPKANPKVSSTRELMNTIFALHPDIQFDPSMKFTINELTYTEATGEGDIIKDDRKDEGKRADFLDCVRYWFWTWCSDFEINMKKYGVK